MLKTVAKFAGSAVLGLSLAAGVGATAQAETTLRMVTNWSKNVYSVKRTLQWVDAFNKSAAAKAAKISIRFVGGPEVTPAVQQLTAVRNGVVDMLFGAAGYYVGQVPEGFVFYGTEVTPMQARKAGGIKLLSDIYQKKANAVVLGWVAAGVGYHVWLKDKPKLKADGTPDLSGLKIRSSGLYRAWLTSMGATNVMVAAPEIYNAMERKLVEGAAWPGLGITDLGFQKFVKYRVDPPVWQFDNLIWVNRTKWMSLNEAQRAALAASVEKFETAAYGYYKDLVKKERAAVTKAGVQSFALTGAAASKYVSDAQALQWAQIKKKAPTNYDQLRAIFPPSK